MTVFQGNKILQIKYLVLIHLTSICASRAVNSSEIDCGD